MRQKKEGETINTIQLQGIGRVQAKEAKEVKVGDTLVWNYGYTSKVLNINFSKTGKTLIMELESDNGYVCNRKLGSNRLVAYT